MSRLRRPMLGVGESELGPDDGSELSPSEGSHYVHSPRWTLSIKRNAQRKFVSAVERIVSLSRRDNSVKHIQRLIGGSNLIELPVVTVGPVIGKVTETTARILVEINMTASITMVLEAVEEVQAQSEAGVSRSGISEWEKSGTTVGATNRHSRRFEVQNTLEVYRPKIFKFENLAPGTSYRIKLIGAHLFRDSGFRTFPLDIPQSVNYAVISCNKIFITEKEIPVHSDLWAHLAKAIENRKIDMCLHLGDQIYGDGDRMLDAEPGKEPGDWSDCFRKSKEQLHKIPKENWIQKYETICEFYRKVYRKTWSHPSTAYCLANCPNLMIYDDHEVRDNWADLVSDRDTKSVDFFVARCAWRANLEYQRQLHEDVDFAKLDQIDKDYHFHLISGVGIMFLDIRGSRTFHRDESDHNKYLGDRQWQDIREALDVGGLFENARVLLLCTPAPLVFLKHNVTSVMASALPRLADFKGHWSADRHVNEQKLMIEWLFHWKTFSPYRDVLVLGGDVHCGGHSDILKDGEVAFRQLTTSAIANHPLPKSAYYSLRAVGSLAGIGITHNLDFRHHNWTRSRNYGVVNVKGHGPEATSKPEVTAQLIKGKFMIGFRDGVKVSNYEESYKVHLLCFRFGRKR